MSAWADEQTTHDVIIGSGLAGLAAGITSLHAGANVVIVEKRRHTGGNSRISDGVVAAAGTDEQALAGIDDSPELLGSDMLAAGLGHNDADWVRVVAAESAEALRWLVDEAGCAFHPKVYHFGGHSTARCLAAIGGGKALVRSLEDRYRHLGGELRTGSTVTDFVVGDDQRVVGVEVSTSTPDTVPAPLIGRRGVVIASGGFAGDVEVRLKHDVRLGHDVGTTNLPDTTAGVLEMAQAIGAASRELEWIQLGPWTSPDERAYGLAPIFTSFVAFPYGVIVDASSGRRYVNELGDRRTQADAMLERGRPSLALAGAAAVELSGQSVDLALRTGCVEAFDDIDALAERYGTDAQALQRTVVEYNEVVAGHAADPVGKPVLEGCPPLCAPFLAARIWPKTHFTMGGLVTDLSTRVLDAERRPIAGLHAAGEVTGGTHGACRLSSMAITECIVQGRRAGESVAQARV